jgi:hypothetical protein
MRAPISATRESVVTSTSTSSIMPVQLGVSSVQATTKPESSGAISFHSSMGFSGELIEDYAGAGNPRVFFELKLAED